MGGGVGCCNFRPCYFYTVVLEYFPYSTTLFIFELERLNNFLFIVWTEMQITVNRHTFCALSVLFFCSLIQSDPKRYQPVNYQWLVRCGFEPDAQCTGVRSLGPPA